MSMSAYYLVGLELYRRFYKGVIFHFHQQLVSKDSIYMSIPIIWRVIMISNEVFFKLRVSYDGLVSRNKVFPKSSNCIETHLDVVVEVVEVQTIVAFEFCLD